MRRVSTVRGLRGELNTEVIEEDNRKTNCDNFFLNEMNPSTHMLLYRLLTELRNQEINTKFLKKLALSLNQRKDVTFKLDGLGRVVINHNSAGQIATLPHVPVAATTLVEDIALDAKQWDRLCTTGNTDSEGVAVMWNSQEFVMDELDLNTLKHPDSVSLSVVDNILLLFAVWMSLLDTGKRVVYVITHPFFHISLNENSYLPSLPSHFENVDIILSAIYQKSHTVLLLIDLNTERLFYLDPKEGYLSETQVESNILVINNFIASVHFMNQGEKDRRRLTGWQYIFRNNFAEVMGYELPNQTGAADCGVISCLFAAHISSNTPMRFNTSGDIVTARRWFRRLIEKHRESDEVVIHHYK